MVVLAGFFLNRAHNVGKILSCAKTGTRKRLPGNRASPLKMFEESEVIRQIPAQALGVSKEEHSGMELLPV